LRDISGVQAGVVDADDDVLRAGLGVRPLLDGDDLVPPGSREDDRSHDTRLRSTARCFKADLPPDAASGIG
jgi:hypothetical protein